MGYLLITSNKIDEEGKLINIMQCQTVIEVLLMSENN